jgi:hypothetical protein
MLFGPLVPKPAGVDYEEYNNAINDTGGDHNSLKLNIYVGGAIVGADTFFFSQIRK